MGLELTPLMTALHFEDRGKHLCNAVAKTRDLEKKNLERVGRIGRYLASLLQLGEKKGVINLLIEENSSSVQGRENRQKVQLKRV